MEKTSNDWLWVKERPVFAKYQYLYLVVYGLMQMSDCRQNSVLCLRELPQKNQKISCWTVITRYFAEVQNVAMWQVTGAARGTKHKDSR